MITFSKLLSQWLSVTRFLMLVKLFLIATWPLWPLMIVAGTQSRIWGNHSSPKHQKRVAKERLQSQDSNLMVQRMKTAGLRYPGCFRYVSMAHYCCSRKRDSNCGRSPNGGKYFRRKFFLLVLMSEMEGLDNKTEANSYRWIVNDFRLSFGLYLLPISWVSFDIQLTSLTPPANHICHQRVATIHTWIRALFRFFNSGQIFEPIIMLFLSWAVTQV